ncbi:hypothetical protein AALO_G00077200 [Alosa alosa]|uniref:Uncharacterized protein n=1 Tax=Alosa alosa TaxID=278164 RepID=A0AAV6GW84_9TELE|nr:hypothetical protein AALO_G00077200 [Alosa alosa]
MPQERENICCREVPQVMRRMTQVPEEITCMIDHPGLEPVCLNIYSLQNAMNIYRADHEQLRIRGMERQCRHLAYRSFVSWCWGFLGLKCPCCDPLLCGKAITEGVSGNIRAVCRVQTPPRLNRDTCSATASSLEGLGS